MLRRIMVSFPIVLLSYLGKMSKAKNGKFCLKLQILLILAYNADVNYIVLLIYYTTLVNKDIAICWVIADDEVNYIMQISQEDAILIKNLYLSRVCGARRLLSEFPDRGWKLGSIDTLLKKIRRTSTMGPAKSRNPRNPRNPPTFTKSSVYIKQIPRSATKSTYIKRKLSKSNVSSQEIDGFYEIQYCLRNPRIRMHSIESIRLGC